MDRDEALDALKRVINSLIKDDPKDESGDKSHIDAANKDLHDVITAKMRDRINPPTDTEVETETDNTNTVNEPA